MAASDKRAMLVGAYPPRKRTAPLREAKYTMKTAVNHTQTFTPERFQPAAYYSPPLGHELPAQ